MTDPISNEKLAPCPFCGGTDIFVEPDEIGSGGKWVTPVHVGCSKCKAEQFADDAREAIAAWNRRQSPAGVEVTVADALSQLSGAIAREAKQREMVNRVFDTLCVNIEKSEPTAGFAEALRDYWLKEGKPALASHEPAPGDTQDGLPLTDEAQGPEGVEPVAWEGYWPGAGSIDSITRLTRHRSTMEEWRGEGAEITPLYASLPPKATTITDEVAGLERAAKWVEARLTDYVQEHGLYDPGTGTTEYPGNGEEYVYELEEIAEGIRALSSEAHNG